MTPDVNILVAASRSDHPHHAPARIWLEQAHQCQPGSCLFLATHGDCAFPPAGNASQNICIPHTPMADALRFIDALLEASGVEPAMLGGEWPILRQLCADKALSDNDVPDAWLAAAAIHQGEHVVSFDADFKRLLPRGRFTRLSA